MIWSEKDKLAEKFHIEQEKEIFQFVTLKIFHVSQDSHYILHKIRVGPFIPVKLYTF